MNTNPNETIRFDCQSCKNALTVPASIAGKKAKCPKCGAIQVVPEPIIDAVRSDSGSDTIGSFLSKGLSGDQSSPQSSAAPTPTSPSPTSPSPAPPAPATENASAVSGSSATTTPDVTFPENQDPPLERKPAADTETSRLFQRIKAEVEKVYVGQEELVLGTLVSLFSSGHVLIESVPGLGKTLFIRTLSKVLGCDYGRIQFTADLMPSDVTGSPIFDMKTQEFKFRPGPVFTQFLLADEINRSPAKTHAALLEIMQEYSVTIDGTSHQLERPFLVMATQNPIESEGTYNLPEAQLDRFMFKLFVDYPNEQEEEKILELHSQQIELSDQLEHVETVTNAEQIMKVIKENSKVVVVPKLRNYINKLVRETRVWPQFHMGASPRAGIALMQAARSLAAFHGREYAIPDDVIEVALPALRHRVILTAEAEVEGQTVDAILKEMIRNVEVPRI